MLANEARIAMIDKLIQTAVERTSNGDGATSMRLTQAALNAAHAYKIAFETPMRRATEESI